jgi:DNA-binding LacI/PurR family transcriptional regulator
LKSPLVRQNRSQLVEAAVEALQQMLERPDEPPPVTVTPIDLVVRESTSRLAASF